MNKIIRLTENDLHNIIRKSVTRILKEEYGVAPNGRQINQQQAIQAANKPTNWEVYAQMRNRNLKNKEQGRAANYGQMADKAAFNQMGYQNKGDVATEYIVPNSNGVQYMQDNVDQLEDKGMKPQNAWFSNQRGMRGFYQNFDGSKAQMMNDPMTQNFSNVAQNFPAPSNDAKQAYNNAYQRGMNFTNRNWHTRMKQKAQQLGNKGIYESKKK